jgi:hypothetical protein
MALASILSGDTVTDQGRTGRGGSGRGARHVPHLNDPKARGEGGDSRGLLRLDSSGATRGASVTKLYGPGCTPFARADARPRRKCKISAALVAIAFFGLIALPIYTVALILDLASAGLSTGVLDRRDDWPG